MKTFTESNICPYCGGRLISDPIVLTSNPPQYQAHCEKCGKVFHSYHMIGEIDLLKIPDGMWDTEATFDPNFDLTGTDASQIYLVDSDIHYTLASQAKDSESHTWSYTIK